MSISHPYRFNGLKVTYCYAGNDRYGWGVVLDFYDDGFAAGAATPDAISIEGTLRTRYQVRGADTTATLEAAVDAVLGDAARLGIEYRFIGPGAAHRMTLFTDGLGWGEGWDHGADLSETEAKEIVANLIASRGWDTPAPLTSAAGAR